VGKRKIRFTATFIDNGNPGTWDNFSISLKRGYSADNNLAPVMWRSLDFTLTADSEN
jgi:hypothetical protein